MLFERNAKYIKIQNKCLYHLYRQNALFYNKTNRQDITVILLKMALNTHNTEKQTTEKLK